MCSLHMDGKVSMVFNRNCFSKIRDFSRLGALHGSHVHGISGCIKEMARDRHVVTATLSIRAVSNDLE